MGVSSSVSVINLELVTPMKPVLACDKPVMYILDHILGASFKSSLLYHGMKLPSASHLYYCLLCAVCGVKHLGYRFNRTKKCFHCVYDCFQKAPLDT